MAAKQSEATGTIRQRGLTHNMADAFRPGIPAWARDFDAWAADSLSRFDVDALKDFQNRAPAARTALPTWEHYAPILVAAGAARSGQASRRRARARARKRARTRKPGAGG